MVLSVSFPYGYRIHGVKKGATEHILERVNQMNDMKYQLPHFLIRGLQFSWANGEELANWTGTFNFTDDGAVKSGSDTGTRYKPKRMILEGKRLTREVSLCTSWEYCVCKRPDSAVLSSVFALFLLMQRNQNRLINLSQNIYRGLYRKGMLL